jgi:hypothetical protein
VLEGAQSVLFGAIKKGVLVAAFSEEEQQKQRCEEHAEKDSEEEDVHAW